MKPVKMWALYQDGLGPIVPLMYTRVELIHHAEWNHRGTWAELRKRGYRAVRVEVTPC